MRERTQVLRLVAGVATLWLLHLGALHPFGYGARMPTSVTASRLCAVGRAVPFLRSPAPLV
jgi:hypothetical protein